MRHSARAILITADNKLLLMKRIKNGDTYYVTVGGGVDAGEPPEAALIRELQEESGSRVDTPRFAFHFDDTNHSNSVDFYIARELERSAPTGMEWARQTPDNQYELAELTLAEARAINLCPSELKDKILTLYEAEIKQGGNHATS